MRDLILPIISIPSESLTFPLRHSAQKYPGKVAVVEPEKNGKEYSYQWLDENSSFLAASLANMGMDPKRQGVSP